MIIDVHVHICPKEIREHRESFLEGEPEFAAIYKNPKARLTGARELIKKMDEEGVDRAVVFGFPWRKEKNFRMNNDYVLDAAKKYPDRLIPFCCFSLENPKIEKELDRCLSMGAKGVGEIAFYTKDIEQKQREILGRVANLCREASVPVLLHTNEPVGHIYPGKSPMTLKNLYLLIKENMETKWILAHLGGGLPFFGLLKKEVKDVLINCWFDTAAMVFLYRPEALKTMMDIMGDEKFLFGTDYPLLPPSRYYKEFEKMGLTKTQMQNIFSKNFLDLKID
jgi:predicted TIM-barrel fold metal-dependent hydrolase